MKRIINNIDEMKSFAREFGKSLKGGEVILLNGDLGAGKTTFVRFVLESLGVEEPVSSPSFTIMKTYSNKDFKFFHFDMYRIFDDDSLYATGFYDYFDRGGVIAAEWCENIPFALPDKRYEVIFEKTGGDARKIHIRTME